mgnify:FL=1
MKKVLLGVFLATGLLTYAQQIQDLPLFGLEQRTGTARFQAMAGAFGALGGDFSALAINPAGAAVFKHSQMGFGLSHFQTENNTQLNATNTQANKGHLGFNQAGIVFVYDNSKNSPWKKISLALNSDNSNQYKSRVNAKGNTSNGLDQYFLHYANGTPFGDILKLDGELLEEAYLNIGSQIGYAAQQAFLGYYSGVLDPAELDNNSISSYVSNALYQQVRQNHHIQTKGRNSKFVATTAAQYKDFLFLGAGLEFQNLVFEKQGRINEDGYSANSPIQYIDFDNFIRTDGNGVALSLGAIARVSQFLRLGVSYKTPTWYTLSEKTHQQIGSNLEDVDIEFIDQNQINLFEDYRITIPSKITLSGALVVGKRGLISVDYSQQDFSTARFKPLNDPYFSNLNSAANNDLGTVNSLNIGGEFNLSRWSFRVGYSAQNSPFVNNTVNTINTSSGLGWVFNGGRIDFAYSQWEQSQSVSPLNFPEGTAFQMETRRNIASMTYTLFF